METENNAWSGITASLNALQDQTLTSVLADSLLGYDGNYVIQAPASAYTTLVNVSDLGTPGAANPACD